MNCKIVFHLLVLYSYFVPFLYLTIYLKCPSPPAASRSKIFETPEQNNIPNKYLLSKIYNAYIHDNVNEAGSSGSSSFSLSIILIIVNSFKNNSYKLYR
jgi:hypothetical protein